MPHTRGNNMFSIICLPAFATYSKHKLNETMKHELIHIDQKQNSELWKQKLLQEGCLPDSSESIPQELYKAVAEVITFVYQKKGKLKK
jgi:type III secretion system FlhB-like substrate exporter